MNIWKLRLSMVGTLAAIIGLSTLVFTVILSLAGVFDILTLGVIVVIFNIIQWLISPYLVGAIYRARELPENENPQLHQIVGNLSEKSKISKPKLMLSQIPIPNAFAYGSPLSGSRVAVTKGLLESLDEDEVEAVIGHELGHLKHRDVQVMMVVSFLPALFYYIGFSLLLSSMYRGQRDEGGGSTLIGMGFMIFSYVLNMFILYLSRLREYYADRHSVSVVNGGAQKLSTGLAKIVKATHKINSTRKPQQKKPNASAYKALFIADPDRANADSAELASMGVQSDHKLVEEITSRKLTFADKLLEAFSTHPNIVKRLRALQELD
ncbi:MAG: zinc metalloprotease HtpX [Candidatus Bathyarchaeia archaeon]|nr:zinc metalloprotease HtpX [Candidatus Bathyarchaeia archaeon]